MSWFKSNAIACDTNDTADLGDAVHLLENALSDGPMPMNEIMYASSIYEIDPSAMLRAAQDIRIAEYIDNKSGKIIWKWHCV